MNWLIAMVILAQIDAPKAAENVRATPVLTKVADPYDAAAWAVEDALALKLREQSAAGCLYLWIGPEEDPNVAKINSLAVNSALSHSSTIQLPDLTAGGRLIRWDLAKLAPKAEDFKRLVGVINDLSIGEPYWHVDLKAIGLPPVKCDPFVHIDGKTYHATFSTPAPATADAYRILQRETGLKTPLMRADYFLRRISSTVQGGHYYRARGFITYDEKGKEKRLNEAEILQILGASTAVSRRVRADDRVGIVRSDVTGQARAVEFIQGAVGPVRITYDRSGDNENVAAHPLYSLLDVVNKSDGRETIFELPNGLFGYIATNGKGELVDEVPANIATNHRTPAPYPGRLYAAIGCVECHAANGGVQRTPNDVARLLRDPKDLDAFADLTGTGFTAEDIDRLAGLYSGDFERRAKESRDRYGDAVFTATRGMTAAQAGAEWSRQFHRYWFDMVNADQQLLELGWKARSPQAANRALTTLLEKTTIDAIINGQRISREDPLIVAPRKGIAIRRQDQERIFAESFRRAYEHRHEVQP